MTTRGALIFLALTLTVLGCTGAVDASIPRDPIPGSAGGAEGAPTGTGGAGVVVAGAAGSVVVPDAGSFGTPPAGTGPVGTGGTSSTGVTIPPSCGPGTIPADVAAVISNRCIACHGTPPIQGVSSSLGTYASLVAPSKADPAKSVVAESLARMRSAATPMPPAPLMAATSAEIGAFQAWVSAGASASSCPDAGAPSDAGAPPDAGVIADPYSTPVVCTSKTFWTGGNSGSTSMDPGMACVSCHATSGEAPKFAIAGTVYPTAHEPDRCNGVSAATMSQVVVTGADGKVVTLTPNAVGNFSYGGALAKPYKVKVTSMGRERAMIAAQTSGDCNSCHTQLGAMMAPGRVMLP